MYIETKLRPNFLTTKRKIKARFETILYELTILVFDFLFLFLFNLIRQSLISFASVFVVSSKHFQSLLYKEKTWE